jgi:branched-chain amino acid transport system ATP-binding protein
MLELEGVSAAYGAVRALDGIDLRVEAGEIVTLVGANGAGKTTLLMTICGRPQAVSGTVRLKGQDITHLPTHRIAALGVAHAPEGRRIFGRMSVRENLQLGARLAPPANLKTNMESVLALFPRLEERIDQRGGTLSGGEQQMLAIGRAMMGRPELLLLDEPSVGIAPRLKGLIFDAIEKIRQDGTAILIVEQDATSTLRIADRVYVLEHGRTVREGRASALAGDEYIRQVYLGV